jgi:arylsulfatase A-like enzyme
MKRALAIVVMLAMAISQAGCGLFTNAQPNFVLITIDCLRADRLHVLGRDPALMENLDGLAAQSTVFANAVAPIATTFPSHSSMLTGLYPRYHGVRWNGEALPVEVPTVGEALQSAGYATGAFVAYRAMLFRGQLSRGFEVVSDEERGTPGEVIRSGADVNRLAFDWLVQRDERPFFLWLHYFEPHEPYHPTEYSREQLPGYDGPFAEGLSVEQLKHGREVREALRDPENQRALNALYDGQVLEADRLVGEVLDFLRAEGVFDDTVIMVAGDHGQGLGDHGALSHGSVLWESVLRVPMVIKAAGSQQHRLVSERVGLVDITPTILELTGLEVPDNLQGRSLMPAIEGEALEVIPYFAEVKGSPQEAVEEVDGEASETDRLAVLRGPFKLVVWRDETTLYDLSRDPGELNPIAPEEAEGLYTSLDELLKAYAAGMMSAEQIELSEEDLRELRALGYIQ